MIGVIKIFVTEMYRVACYAASWRLAKEDRIRPLLRSRDVCKRDMKALDTDVNKWEYLASDRTRLRQELGSALRRDEGKRQRATDERRRLGLQVQPLQPRLSL